MPGPVYLYPDDARKMDPPSLLPYLLLVALFMATAAPGPSIIAGDGVKPTKRPEMARATRVSETIAKPIRDLAQIVWSLRYRWIR